MYCSTLVLQLICFIRPTDQQQQKSQVHRTPRGVFGGQGAIDHIFSPCSFIFHIYIELIDSSFIFLDDFPIV